MKRKWTLFTFSRGDFKTLERYLNEQAEKGWELEKAGILARWKRTERQDLCYAVDLANPRQKREDRLTYLELCGESGWELTALTGQMYIFKSRPGITPIPIQTDPELERSNYNRYYIGNCILGVVVLALYFLFWVGLGALLGGDLGETLRAMKYERLDNWAFEGLVLVMPVWAVWAAWKLADFIRAAIKGRAGEIGNSPRWVLWLNGWMTLLAGAGAVVFFGFLTVETLLATRLNLYLYGLTLLGGGVLFYRAIAIEKELFRGERRRHIVLGAVLLVCFAALVAGRTAVPDRSWSTYTHGEDPAAGVAAYEETFALELVHGEDLGIPFEPEKDETVYVTRRLYPAGERWSVSYYYGEGKNVHMGVTKGCEVNRCFTRSRAELLTEALVYYHMTNRFGPWSEENLLPVDIPWADEAWYGVIEMDGGVLSLLILRVGNTVARICYPLELLEGTQLEVIRAEIVQ